VAERFEALEQRDVAATLEPLVEERMRDREHHRAVHVVLRLLVGEVADAYRPHPAVAGQRLDDALVEELRAAITMSQHSARFAPAPAATPFTAAITGTGMERTRLARGR
jgi:hypothetical protein